MNHKVRLAAMRAFLKLPMKERRKILRKQAVALMKSVPDYGDVWKPQTERKR